MTQEMLRGRALVAIAVAGVLAAAIASVAALWVLSLSEPRYRAEMQVAMLPGRQVPAAEVADYWEALSRGQAARIGAEVLGQRRWIAPAAQAAGVPIQSISTSSGAVADTSLIKVAAEADTPGAAETAVGAVFREARPLVEQVSGPFALEVVQDPGGSAVRLGTSPSQLLGVAAVTGLLLGVGAAVLLIRHPRWRGRLVTQPALRDSAAEQAAPDGRSPNPAHVNTPDRADSSPHATGDRDGRISDPTALGQPDPPR